MSTAPQPLAHRTRIKICGLTREQDVAAAVEAGADAVGFVLYAKSPRHVSAARAGELARALPPFVTPVLLFVNESPAAVRAACASEPLRPIAATRRSTVEARSAARREEDSQASEKSTWIAIHACLCIL